MTFHQDLPTLRKRDHLAHDVFISHASQDKTVADAVCASLEQAGIRCWIAPRDILPGADWGQSIVAGIKASQAMVLVFSAAANGSRHVPREVERALSQGNPVIPFRIEDVSPQGGLEYHLGTVHWLDAMSPPFDAHLARLTEILKATLHGLQAAPSAVASASIVVEPEHARTIATEARTRETKPVTPAEPLNSKTKTVTQTEPGNIEPKLYSASHVDRGQATLPDNRVESGKRYSSYREVFDSARYGTNWLLVPALTIASMMNGGLSATSFFGALFFAALHAVVFALAVHRLSIVPAVGVIASERAVAYIASWAVVLANAKTGPRLSELVSQNLAAVTFSVLIGTAAQLAGMNWVLRRMGLSLIPLTIVTAVATVLGYECLEAAMLIGGNSASPGAILGPAVWGAFNGVAIWIACRIFLRKKAVFAGMEIRK